MCAKFWYNLLFSGNLKLFFKNQVFKKIQPPASLPPSLASLISLSPSLPSPVCMFLDLYFGEGALYVSNFLVLDNQYEDSVSINL